SMACVKSEIAESNLSLAYHATPRSLYNAGKSSCAVFEDSNRVQAAMLRSGDFADCLHKLSSPSAQTAVDGRRPRRTIALIRKAFMFFSIKKCTVIFSPQTLSSLNSIFGF